MLLIVLAVILVIVLIYFTFIVNILFILWLVDQFNYNILRPPTSVNIFICDFTYQHKFSVIHCAFSLQIFKKKTAYHLINRQFLSILLVSQQPHSFTQLTHRQKLRLGVVSRVQRLH